ncbi:cytochrome P450 716A67-like [Daucus carota subsp. sativus]|uniref:cytochrome P450 716A67-like n=1 Tax=Daucus carota subsp. sativus TaxID=79200 RepID=UPI003083BECB
MENAVSIVRNLPTNMGTFIGVFLLAVDTDWQDKARKEVVQHFGQENPSSDGIARLKSMNMIINESLRLYKYGAKMFISSDQKDFLKGWLKRQITMLQHSFPSVWGLGLVWD